MGHVGHPSLLGDDCNNCDNLLWPPHKTPRKIVMVVDGMEKSVGWLFSRGEESNGPYTLWQTEQYSCIWETEEELPGAELKLTPNSSELRIWTDTGWGCFAGIHPTKCLTSFISDDEAILMYAFKGGTAYITW